MARFAVRKATCSTSKGSLSRPLVKNALSLLWKQAGFFSLSASNIWGWLNLCSGRLSCVLCNVSNIHSLYPLNVSSISIPTCEWEGLRTLTNVPGRGREGKSAPSAEPVGQGEEAMTKLKTVTTRGKASRTVLLVLNQNPCCHDMDVSITESRWEFCHEAKTSRSEQKQLTATVQRMKEKKK